jgi:hypothetical protein
MAIVSKNLSAANSFTDALSPTAPGYFNLSVSGAFSGTITLQRSFDNGGAWLDVAPAYTAPTEEVVLNPEAGVQWRIGFKTGQYTSGTASVRLSQ